MTPREDLVKSGLNEDYMKSMSIRSISSEELADLNLHNASGGYVIPYYDVSGGKLTDYWRIKLLPPLDIKGKLVKYVQPKGSISHAYLPPTISSSDWSNTSVPLYITEGEKKAARGAQEGLCCLGLGGVDAWRTRSFKISAEKLTEHENYLTVKVEKNTEAELILEQICPELLAIPLEGRRVFVVFDSDARSNPEVQRALFEICLWLQGEGADAKSIYLSNGRDGGKRGLDDFLCEEGIDAFRSLPAGHPEHPRVKAWIRGQLDRPRLSRSTQVKCARTVLNSLDTRGQRFVNPATGEYYYRDDRTNILHGFRWDSTEIRQIRLSSFGNLLQQEFGIGTADASIMARIADLFASGRDLKKVQPRRVSWTTDDALYYQLSDSFVAKVTAQGIEVVDNGTDDVLFLSDQVEPLCLPPTLLCGGELGESKWMQVIRTTQLQPMPGMSLEETQLLVACMFYLNPLFRRWRGMMLPLELAISEPNSGKSFLYNLRRSITTGRPSLNNPPVSLRDWYSQLTAAPGIYVCDNVGELARDVREQISDELARMVTDPDPKIEMRKLYTTTEVGVWPVDATFAFTSIRNPFWKPDLLQRSLVIQLKAIPAGQRDSRWYQRQIEGTGRADWVIDHLRVAQRFLASATSQWDEAYLSSHRLVHFEQAILHMGKALGYEELVEQVVKKLFLSVQETVTNNDPILEALKVFAKEWKKTKIVKTADVVNWSQMDMEQRFTHIRVLANPIALGRYMGTHEYDISNSIGLVPIKRHNQTYYEIIRQDEDEIVVEGEELPLAEQE